MRAHFERGEAMIERWFGPRAAGSDVRTEVVAGITTFLTMSYIIFVQPAVLSGAMFDAPTGMDFGAVTAATCLSAALASLLMGLYANYPIAQAPGMGQNFFFVFSILPAVAATGHPQPWRVALGVIFISGVLFLLVSLTGLREALVHALSPSMKSALGAGIGLFIAFIGLQNAGVVRADSGTGVSLNPSFTSPDHLVFFFGLAVAAALHVRRVRGSLLWAIVASFGLSLVWWAWGTAPADSMLATRFAPGGGIVSAPPSLGPTFLQMDLWAALAPSLIPLVILVLFMDVFDTLGTLVAVSQEAGLLHEGRLARGRRAMLSDAVGTVAGAGLGTSTVTSYIESAAGVEQGGRTGLVAVVVGLLFVAALPLTPLIAMVGSYPPVTAPALVIVGALMMRAVARVEWNDPTESIPAFLTFAGIPFTYSIADGLAIGLISYPVLKVAAGRVADLRRSQVVLAIVLALYFVVFRSQLP